MENYTGTNKSVENRVQPYNQAQATPGLRLTVQPLAHGSILFLETLAHTFTMLQKLFRASHNTSLLLVSQLGRGKVVDTVTEASFDQV